MTTSEVRQRRLENREESPSFEPQLENEDILEGTEEMMQFLLSAKPETCYCCGNR